MSSAFPINELQSKLANVEIRLPNDQGYEHSVKRWNAAIEYRPQVVIRPRSMQDISSTLKFCQEHALGLVVSGGGHFAGDLSGHTNEVLLNLSELNQVKIDAEKGVAVVQGGALTGDVAQAAATHGLAPVLPNVSKVGFTRISLCGGYGPLTGQFGLMADNLLSAQVVLADGSIVTASPRDHTELFWALRGAGAHVGVVAEVTVQLHQLHNENQVLAGALVFEHERATEVLQALNKIVPENTGRGTALIVLAAPPPSLTLKIIVSIFYDGTEKEAKALWDPVFSLKPSMDSTSVMPYPAALSLVDWTAARGQRQLMGHGVFRAPLAQSTLMDVIHIDREFKQRGPGTISIEVLFEFHDLIQTGKVPNDATAFPHRGLDQNIMVVASYLHDSDDEIARKFVHSVTQLTRSRLLDANGERKTGVYTGYDNHLTDTYSVFGKEKYSRLLSLKEKYDPNGVFNRWYPLDI